MIRPEVEFYWPKVGDLFTKPCDISLLQFLYIGDSMLYCYIPQSKNSGFPRAKPETKNPYKYALYILNTIRINSIELCCHVILFYYMLS